MTYASLADKAALETVPFNEAMKAPNVFALLAQTAEKHGPRPAVSFQIKSGPKDRALTLTWAELHAGVARTANLFRDLGVGPGDVVAYLLPNCNETALALLGGMTAGIVNPVNPLLEPEQIGHILNETGAKVLVTLAPMPKADVAQKAAAALRYAPGVKHVLTVDLKRYLDFPLSLIVPLIRPKVRWPTGVTVADFNDETAKRGAKLAFENDATPETICAYFHTGGTTGTPKVAQHNHRGALYNGWVADAVQTQPDDVLLCPLPLFHVFAAYPMLLACVATGAHLVMPTPQGFRGDGVIANFWGLVERWGVTFIVMVPTAAAALMQRPINADVSTLKNALCGSAPLPRELFNAFEKATKVSIQEGYGMTEATCLISGNPPDGEKKIGSVGIPFPHTEVRILMCADDGTINKECAVDEVGEICVRNPGVFPGYTEEKRNFGLFAEGGFLRTGDLGRLDADGYLWITGRAKDLIIRGGHNIDPAVIEEALIAHPAVAFVGAIGQPDAYSGEVPCAYVELKENAQVDGAQLVEYARAHIAEHAAAPKYVEVMPELPKTAVGKVFKPDLRRAAVARIYAAALEKAGIGARVVEVIDSKSTGITAIVEGGEDEAIDQVLGRFPPAWARPSAG